MKWTIYSSDGAERYTGATVEYSGTWMGECFLTVTVTSPSPIDFQPGDYIDYRGERFSIDYDLTLLKKSSSGTYGEGFTYTDIKFASHASELESMRFHDRVLSDNNMAYTSLPDVVVYCGSVDDLVDRLQANANAWCKASGIDVHDYWMFFTYDESRISARVNDMTTNATERASLLSEKKALWTAAYGGGTGDARKDEKFDRNVSMSGQTVAEALTAVKSCFGLNYIIRGRNVYIGTAGVSVGHVFKYGKGNGLYEFERSVNQDYPVYTKIYAYGSTDNLPSGYYNNLNTSVYADIESVTSIAMGELYAYYVEFVIDIDFLPRLFTYPRKYNASDNSYVVQVSVAGNTARGRIYSNTDIDDNTTTRIYCEYGVDESSPEDNFNLEDFKKFLSGIKSGERVYFTGYVNKSAWPSDHKTTLTENLPDNMSVNSLMLPGFPNAALSTICRSVYDSSTDVTSFQIRKDAGSTDWTTFHTEDGKHLVEWSTDAHDPYLLSPNTDIYGIREGDVHANEENDDNGLKSVYPTIEEMTDVEAGTGTSGVRLDAVATAPVIDDNGNYPQNGKSTIPGFTVTIPDLGFSLSQAVMDAGGKSCVLGMTDGYCAGREFSVSTVRQNTDGTWALRCKRSQDSGLGLYFPYSYHKSIGGDSSSDEPYQICVGDHYVLTGISLEATNYVWAASVRLLKKAVHWLCENDHPRYVYTPRVDEIFMARQSDSATLTDSPSLHDELREGRLMDFSDSDLGITGSVYIDKLTIKEDGNNGIPTYEVTLRDNTKSGTIQQMQGQLSVLGGGVEDVSESASSAQDAADETAESIAFIQDDIKDIIAALAKKLDTAWFASLFTVYDTDGLKVEPNDYTKTVESIRAMFGFWTDRYLAALGKNDDSGGTGGVGLDEATLWALLVSGGASEAYALSQIGIEHLTDALKEYVTQAWIEQQGYATTEWVQQQDYATNAALTAGLAKKLDTAWFASLFTVYDTDGLKVEPNDYTKTVESIRAMFGFWTDRYLAALGKTDSVAYHEVYLTDENGNYLLDHDGNFITTTRMLAALEGGVNEDDLWALLAPDGAGDVYATAQIGLEHLTDALKEYMGTVDLSQYATSTDVTAQIGAVTKSLGVHTSRTDNPHGVTKAQVGLGNVENTALSTWAGTNKITTLGTITTGTWHGSKIANAYLENSSVTIAGLSLSLGGSLTAAQLAKKFYWANVQLSDTSSTTTTPTFKAITIGSVTLSCDTDGYLHIDKGVYSDGFVSALGKNAGATSTGMSEAEMWEALGTDSSTKVIPAEHLDLSGVSGGEVDLSDYYTSEQTDALLSKKSATGHTHTKSQITDFPTSLKNPTALTIKLNGTEAASYDGSSAKTVNVTPAGIGAAASSHTHTKSQITDFPTSMKNPSALSWSGYSSGSYDGSETKNIEIPSNTSQLTNGAGFITSSGSISGNAATATKLQTARTLTIGNTGKTFNGTANVSWTLSEIGAAATSHTHSYTSLGVTQFLNANTSRSGTTGGVTLYGGVENYAILFRQTSQFGTHGTVTGGWATYFTMDTDSDSRGWIFRRWNSGNVASIDINGNMTLSGTSTATNFIATSDMRLKNVLKDVVVGSEALANAPLFVFRWKQGGDKADHIGTSAQYWQEQCPQIVSENDGQLGVDYGALGVAAGVSLAREVVELRDRVRTLEERLAKLEALIAKTGGAE